MLQKDLLTFECKNGFGEFVEKKYVIASVRLESKEIVSIELVDVASQTPVVETAFLRLKSEAYGALGKPTVGERLNVSFDVEKSTA